MNTERVVGAFQYAAELHADQARKGTSIPYISHLMAVAGTVMEHDGDEDQVIAALLHDAIEDHPRNGQTREEIRERFGHRVLDMVEDCTDADTDPKPPWRERKERYLAHLPAASPEAKLISLADKVHNARAILNDFLQIGDEIWKRFKPSKDGTLWYYRSLADTFTREHPGPLAQELERVVSELERGAGRVEPPAAWQDHPPSRFPPSAPRRRICVDPSRAAPL
jgi:(p)ppGpp synthase/HD superfamily hydrolase